MKKCIFVLVFCFCSVLASAGLWTIHSFRDNAPTVTWSNPTEYWMSMWDLAWDLANPGNEDSGVYHAFIGYGWDSSNIGYEDTYVLDLPDDAWLVRVNMYGPYPDYNGWDGHLYWPGGTAWNNLIIPPSTDINSPPAGEYWLDYDSTGIARLSTVKASDFGKWAWDGNVNPSWVEPPLVPAQQGKRLAKGHNK